MAKSYKNSEKKSVRPNPFVNANDMYLTKNKIAVISTTKESAKRGYTKTHKTKYYARNDKNMRQLKKVTDIVRGGRTGTKYARL